MHAERTDLRDNNFDAVRLSLATCIFMAHATCVFFPALQSNPLFWLPVMLRNVAIECFFVLSGFLVFMSWDRAPDCRRFFSKRAARILPAYVAVVLACAIGGALLTSRPVAEYFSLDWVRFLFANLFFVNFFQESLPGAFDNGVTGIVNYPLWTVKIELLFYLSVPALAISLGRFRSVFWIINLYLLSLLYRFGVEHYAIASDAGWLRVFAKQLPAQFSFFIAGYALYRFFPAFMKWKDFAFGAAVFSLILQSYYPWMLLRPAAIAIIVIYCAYSLPRIKSFHSIGDLSYGVFLFHFPVLHVIAEHTPLSGTAAFALSAIYVFGIAFLSWRWLEHPILARVRGADERAEPAAGQQVSLES
ncbi:MAG: acyltransferase [Pirellulaceae bacterium]|nr:acyltransferase [Pirellulaceae bacterium]